MRGFPLATLASHPSLGGAINGSSDGGGWLLNHGISCLGKSSPLLVAGSWCRGLRLFSLGSLASGFPLGGRSRRWWSALRSLILGLGLLWLCPDLGSARVDGCGSRELWDPGLRDRLVWVDKEYWRRDGDVSDIGGALALLQGWRCLRWRVARSDLVDGGPGLVVGGSAYWWRVRPPDIFTEVGLFFDGIWALGLVLVWASLLGLFCFIVFIESVDSPSA